MNLSGNYRAIQDATRDLAVKWRATRAEWRDQKAEEFERRHLAELFAAVERAAPVAEELSRLILKARRDCE